MTELLTESFCERCGTRYTFESSGPRKSRVGRVRVLSKGLRNFVLSDETTMSEALADARSEEELAATAHQLDAFHKTFNFCLSCRQYTCANCWNEIDGRCLGCVPIPGRELPVAVVADVPAEAVDLVAAPEDAAAEGAGEPDAWPETDLSRRLGVFAAVEAAQGPEDTVAEEDEVGVADVAHEAVAEAEVPGQVVLGLAPGQSLEDALAAYEAELDAEALAAYEAELDAEALAGVDTTPVVAEVAEEPEPELVEVPDVGIATVPVVAVEPEPEPVLVAEPEPALAELVLAAAVVAEPEPVLVAEPEPAPVAEPVAVVEPEPVLAAEPEMEPEPEPAPVAELVVAAAVVADPEPEPVVVAEPVAVMEPEPDLAAAPEMEPEPEPVPASGSDDIVAQPTWPVPPASPAPIEAPAPPPAPAQPAEPGWLTVAPDDGSAPQWPTAPAWSSRPSPRPGVQPTLAGRPLLPQGDATALWAASAQEVLSSGPAKGFVQEAMPAPTAQPCISCGLSLSANARFCRRCGTRQA